LLQSTISHFDFIITEELSVFSVPAFVSSDCKGHECVNLELRNGLPAPSGQCWEIQLTVQCGRWTAGAFSICRPPLGTYNGSRLACELTWHFAMRGAVVEMRTGRLGRRSSPGAHKSKFYAFRALLGGGVLVANTAREVQQSSDSMLSSGLDNRRVRKGFQSSGDSALQVDSDAQWRRAQILRRGARK
jgi:hypothetical protein